jgi:hypothetical protein
MVAQLVGQELGRPVAVDADPKNAIALGAAWHAGRAQATEVLPAVAEPLAATPDAAPRQARRPAPGRRPAGARPAPPEARHAARGRGTRRHAPPRRPRLRRPRPRWRPGRCRAGGPAAAGRRAAPAPPREPEPVTEVMRTTPAPTQIMPAAAWRRRRASPRASRC